MVCSICENKFKPKGIHTCVLCGEVLCPECGQFNNEGVCVNCIELVNMTDEDFNLEDIDV